MGNARALPGYLSMNATYSVAEGTAKPYSFIYELLPAFLISLFAIIVVSLLTKAPDESIEKEFEAAKAAKTK